MDDTDATAGEIVVSRDHEHGIVIVETVTQQRLLAPQAARDLADLIEQGNNSPMPTPRGAPQLATELRRAARDVEAQQ